MELKLNNPLLFFDLETTGLNIACDRIVEIAAVKVFPDGHVEEKRRYINPEMPIPKEAQDVHHITDEMVKDQPTFRQIAKSLAQWMEGCDIAGYNSTKFDIPLLAEEFLRAGVEFDFRKRKLIDVQNIFHKMEQRTLVAAYAFYCNKDLEGAHSALEDAKATYEVLKAQLDKYDGTLQNDVKFLADFTTRNRLADYAGRFILNDNDEPVFNFGKYKGRKVEDVLRNEPSYYDWMMNGDFTLDTKKVLTQIYTKTRSKA
ncbi:MAG: 3'-5' exonuclease [Bacteroidales bacterium]|nr:3'-5' exonuclease [Bacteroidales bacterium]